MISMLLNALSPAGKRGRLSTLMFHRVLPEPDPLFPSEIDARKFDEICGWVSTWFNVLQLDEALVRLARGDLPSRALAITFDDGYADNHDIALPILKRHGLCATFYIATGFLDGGRMWNDSVIESVRASPLPVIDLLGTPAAELGQFAISDVLSRRRAIAKIIGSIKYRPLDERSDFVNSIIARSKSELPNDLMMSSAKVKALHDAGMLVGAHTVSHPILAGLAKQLAEEEIAQSKHHLEALLGARVGQFAYPNGKPGEDYSAQSTEIVKRLGFDAAVSTVWGAARRNSDLFQIPRFTPWDRNKLRFGLRMAKNIAKS